MTNWFDDKLLEEDLKDNIEGLSIEDNLKSLTEQRQQCNFVGLMNQGATCYLNSLIQAMFMTPELRSAIFKLPLYDKTINSPSPWLPDGQKREILSALQELFVSLQALNVKSYTTQNLTNSFHWTNKEVHDQHDVQELNRVLYDTIERTLVGSEYSDLISNLYKGIFINEIQCFQCQGTYQINEDFFDIVLQVKGNKDIKASLESLQAPDMLSGDNQYFCENCKEKCDAMRCTRIKQLPPILTFSLNRITFDAQKLQRVKVTDNFEFPLELDLSSFAGKEKKYELFAVIIHYGAGSSFGHYHAYIRDVLKTGNWIGPKKSSTNNETVKLESSTSDGFKTYNTRKRSKKNLKRKGKQYPQKKKEETKEESQKINIDFDYEEFPYGCENKELLFDWYDFNDSYIYPIHSGKLLKQFGGNKETAYMLIYRDTNLNQHLNIPDIPEYWINSLDLLLKPLIKETIPDKELSGLNSNETTVEKNELFKLYIHLTLTGFPDECESIDEVSVPKDMSLLQLKEHIFQLPKIYEENSCPENLRIRERTEYFWFGKIYKENEKSLDDLGITDSSNLVIKVLPEPESFKQGFMQFYVSEWLIDLKQKSPPIEGFFDGSSPNIDKLYFWIRDTLKNDWNIQDITIAIYKSALYEWEIIKDTRKKRERGSLINSRVTRKAKGIQNLRKSPYFLKEGDYFVVKNDPESLLDDGEFLKLLNGETKAPIKDDSDIKDIKDIKDTKDTDHRAEKSLKIAEF